MNGHLHVSAIRLVNFHNFLDETIPVKGSLFLLGENGSGKTTVLDAIHFALTAGVDVEWNAAARLTPRGREGGRSLQGVLLRHDQERGVRHPAGTIGYVALELQTADGSPAMVIGCGGHARSLDSQVDVWGFIKTGPLADLTLVVAEGGARRVLDQSELRTANPAMQVLDKGRYRTRVGEQLFGSRAAFEESMRLIKAGKAYRELVTRIQDPADLFRALLPPPDATVFEDILTSLEDIERVEANRQDLEEEVKHLTAVLGLLHDLERAREDQARYAWLEARLERERQATALERERRDLTTWQADQVRQGEEEAALRRTLAECHATVERIRTTQVFQDQQRLEELRSRLAGESSRAEAAGRRLQQARQGEAEARGRRQAQETACHRQRDEVADLLRGYPGEDREAIGERIAPVLTGLPATLPAYGGEFERLTEALEAVTDRSRGLILGQTRELEATERQLAETKTLLETLRTRGEVLPAVAGVERLYQDLRAAGIRFQPLYRCCDPAAGEAGAAAGLLEQILGPAELASVVVGSEAEEAARARVLAQPWGIPVIDAGPGPAPAGEAGVPSVVDAVRVVGPDGPAVAAYLRRRWGALRLLSSVPAATEEPAAYATTDGLLRFAGSRRRVAADDPRFFGHAARHAALAKEMADLQEKMTALEASVHAWREARRQEEERLAAVRAYVRSFREKAHPDRLESLWTRLADIDLELARLSQEAAQRAEEAQAQDAVVSQLARECATLESSLANSEAAALMAELASHQARHQELSRDLEAKIRQLGQTQVNLQNATGQVGRREALLQQATLDLEARREALLRFPAVQAADGDVERFVLKVRGGQQIKAENVAERRRLAELKETEILTRLRSSEGVRHTLLLKHSLALDEAAGQVLSPRGEPLTDLVAEQAGSLKSLTDALEEKNRKLLERLFLADLVQQLNNEMRRFRETMRELNALLKDLSFGGTWYRFRESVRPDYQRLVELLRKVSDIDPRSRQDLQGFFQAHLQEVRRPDGGMPPLLDYREWFEVVLQTGTGKREEGVSLDWKTRSVGSGGEQAVPNYLILLSLAKLHFDHSGSRLRVLLIDEAFFGIDAGRRDELLRFSDRLALTLIVAHPDLDGVTEAMRRSTTILIEKTPNGDVYLGDFHWALPEAQGDLFAERQPRPPAVIDTVAGDPP